ncbi:MAG TPA: type IV pilin-like G/H family protein [Nostocaceae cyanobacterium]|nr:type IV pilin-like G/H family protein [Nostocaceae cyanobacterium]
MSVNFKVKLLRHCFNKKNNQGVTLPEVLILLVVLGGLLMLFLPCSFSQPNRIGSSEAKNNIGAMNRVQQAYFLETNGKFARTIKEMNIGIKEQTTNYNYYTQITQNTAFNYAIARHSYINRGWFEKRPINSYVGAVFVVTAANKSELNTIAIVCQNNNPGTNLPSEPTYKNGILKCGAGTKEISR